MTMMQWSRGAHNRQGRGGGQEELPHVQGKEQWLHFAEAAMKRYPTSKVKRNPGKMVDAERGH